MNIQVILAAIIVAGAILIGVAWASGEGAIDLPDWLPGTNEVVFIDSMDVKVHVRDLPFGDPPGYITIEDHTIVLKQKTVALSIGPLFFGDRSAKGEFSLETINADGYIIDSESRNYEVWAEVWELQKSKTFTLNNLKLGPPDSGRYEIRASMYDEQGNLVDRESVWRTI